MKKFVLFILALAIIFSLSGCAEKQINETGAEKPKVRFAVMTGPTGVGSVNLIEQSHIGESAFDIEESVVGTPDEIVAALVSGNLDMAVVPANLASVLFNKTEGKIHVLATNNLGVLYIVEIGNEIQSIQDLKGRTVLSAGKGATPETVFNYIMEGNGFVRGTDWDFDFKSEAAEAAQNLLSGVGTVALLPEPMVTSVLSKNENARVAINLDEEWQKLSATPQITAVLVGRSEFLESIDTDAFLNEFKASIEKAVTDIEGTSELLGKYNIIKAEVALKSIPNMNLHYMDKEELKNALTEYLNILFNANPKSVGGKVPGEEFFYLGK